MSWYFQHLNGYQPNNNNDNNNNKNDYDDNNKSKVDPVFQSK